MNQNCGSLAICDLKKLKKDEISVMQVYDRSKVRSSQLKMINMYVRMLHTCPPLDNLSEPALILKPPIE